VYLNLAVNNFQTTIVKRCLYCRFAWPWSISGLSVTRDQKQLLGGDVRPNISMVHCTFSLSVYTLSTQASRI